VEEGLTAVGDGRSRGGFLLARIHPSVRKTE
jgi:hypothetical protein